MKKVQYESFVKLIEFVNVLRNCQKRITFCLKKGTNRPRKKKIPGGGSVGKFADPKDGPGVDLTLNLMILKTSGSPTTNHMKTMMLMIWMKWTMKMINLLGKVSSS